MYFFQLRPELLHGKLDKVIKMFVDDLQVCAFIALDHVDVRLAVQREPDQRLDIVTQLGVLPDLLKYFFVFLIGLHLRLCLLLLLVLLKWTFLIRFDCVHVVFNVRVHLLEESVDELVHEVVHQDVFTFGAELQDRCKVLVVETARNLLNEIMILVHAK